MRFLQYLRREVLGNEKARRWLVALQWTVAMLIVAAGLFTLLLHNHRINEMREQLKETVTVEHPTPKKDEAPEPQPTDDKSEWLKTVIQQYQNGEL